MLVVDFCEKFVYLAKPKSDFDVLGAAKVCHLHNSQFYGSCTKESEGVHGIAVLEVNSPSCGHGGRLRLTASK